MSDETDQAHSLAKKKKTTFFFLNSFELIKHIALVTMYSSAG